MSENQKQSVEGSGFEKLLALVREGHEATINEEDVEVYNSKLRKFLSQQQLEVVEMIEKIDFFGWHKDTQRLIKDKVLQSLSTLTTLNNK